MIGKQGPRGGRGRVFCPSACFLLLLLFQATAPAVNASHHVDLSGAAAPGLVCEPIFPIELNRLKSLLPRFSRVNALHTDDLPRMKERKAIRVLTDYSKTNYFLQDKPVICLQPNPCSQYRPGTLHLFEDRNCISLLTQVEPQPLHVAHEKLHT